MRNVIVTITDKTRSFACDFELPVNAKIKKLKEHIVEALNGYNPNLQLNVVFVELYCTRKGKNLVNDETLEEAGVWDGDYIVVL